MSWWYWETLTIAGVLGGELTHAGFNRHVMGPYSVMALQLDGTTLRGRTEAEPRPEAAPGGPVPR